MKYVFIMLLLSLCIACGNRTADPSQKMAETVANFGDFEDFYKRFHWDSTFQISRINFPLEGLPQDADSSIIVENNFHWTKENWTMHRGFEELKNDFTQEFIPFGTDIITERIIHVSGTVGMIRRFARLNGKWYLIYYAGLNRISPTKESSPTDKAMDS